MRRCRKNFEELIPCGNLIDTKDFDSYLYKGMDRCGGFTYIMESDPDAVMISCIYEFLEPGWLSFRRLDGSVETLHYGLGERVEKLEPAVQYCVVPSRQWNRIPCPDGSEVIARSDARMRRLCGGMQEWVNQDDRFY